MRKVFVLNPSHGYLDLFLDAGYEAVNSIENADLVCFTGGEDVSPSLYDEGVHRNTHTNSARDKLEEEIYEKVLASGKAMVGICRGGQFLNVMNGGKMYQHVTKHLGDHPMRIRATGEIIIVSSTHHQMMRPSDEAIVLAVANQGGTKEHVSNGYAITQIAKEDDIEVVWYKNTKCLCFQPHPEFGGDKYTQMRKYFFDMINKRLFSKD